MAAPNSLHRWLLKWRLDRNIRHYVELATADCRLYLDREPVTFRAALGEVGRWVVDYIKGRQPISWPERRYFVGAFRGFTPTKTTHERAFAGWLHSCWLADQYPNASISVPHHSLFSPALKARCAERETELLNQFLAVVPAYDELQWFDRYANEDEVLMMEEVELQKLETKREFETEADLLRWRESNLREWESELEAAADRLRGLNNSDGIEFDTDDYEKAIDEYIERTYGLH